MNNPIKGNETKKIEIDMGELNCIGEPYFINLSGSKFILRYKIHNESSDYGKLILEAMADDNTK